MFGGFKASMRPQAPQGIPWERGVFDDADEVVAAPLLAVDFTEEPKVCIDAFKAMLGGGIRREGEDKVLDAVAVRIGIGDAEDKAFLLGLGHIQTLFTKYHDVHGVLGRERERISRNFDNNRIHLIEGVFKEGNRRVL